MQPCPPDQDNCVLTEYKKTSFGCFSIASLVSIKRKSVTAVNGDDLELDGRHLHFYRTLRLSIIMYFSTASAREANKLKGMPSRLRTRVLCVYLSIRRRTSAASVSSRETGDPVMENPSVNISRFRWCAPKSSPSDDFNTMSTVNLQSSTGNTSE